MKENQTRAPVDEVANEHLQLTKKEIRALKEEGKKLSLDLQQHINTSGMLLEFRVQYTEEAVIIFFSVLTTILYTSTRLSK